MLKKLAIVGATGMLGRPVAKELIAAGFDVTMLVRNVEKARQTFGSGIQFIKGDLADVGSVQQLLEGQDGLYVNLSVQQTSADNDFQPEREGLANVLSAAKKSTVKRVGYLSSLVHFYQGQNGFNWWPFEIKKQAIEKIKCSGIPYTIFYASTFMESFDQGGYRQGSNIALAGTSHYKMYLIAGSDYGRQVVKAFQLNNGNQEYVVQGEDGYTADEAAKFYADHSAKKIKIMKAPIGLLKVLGIFSNKFRYGANIIEALNNYPEKFDAERTWHELGKPQTRFIDYIKSTEA